MNFINSKHKMPPPIKGKTYFANIVVWIEEEVRPALITSLPEEGYWWCVGEGFHFSIEEDRLVEWLDESEELDQTDLWDELVDIINDCLLNENVSRKVKEVLKNDYILTRK